MTFRLALLALVSLTVANTAEPARVLVARDGGGTVSVGGRDFATIAPGLFDKSWRGQAATGAESDLAGDLRRFAFKGEGIPTIAGEVRYTGTGDAVTATWAFTPATDGELNSLHVGLDASAAVLTGGTWKADGKSGGFPRDFSGETGIFSGQTRSLTIAAADGRTLTLAFAQPVFVLVQDNRKWGPSFSIRLGVNARLKAGKAQTLAATLSAPGGLTLGFDRPVTMAAGDDWLPLKHEIEIETGSILDFSRLGFTDAPAGKHGRVIATSDGHFAFAKKAAERQRFYGVNLCFGAQFISHEESDRLAERFVRLGYNTVRIHHYEGELLNWKPGLAWDADKLDRFDYLLAALGRRGIYLTTDLFVSRPVAWSQVGRDTKGNVPMNTYKVLVPVSDAAWEDWKAFTRLLLTHVNPYSKLAYAQDPALAWLAMINEGNFENYWGEIKGLPEWTAAFNRWLAQRYGGDAGLAKAWGDELAAGEELAKGSVKLPGDLGGSTKRARDMLLFLAITERDMFARMRAFVKDELGCQALLSNANAWTNRVASAIARDGYDYVDDHFYIDHPQFLEREWQLPSRCPNTNPLSEGATGGRGANFVRLLGKPFTITEYNYSGPGRFRGVGGILTGAMGAFQDWAGIWRFAYAHNGESMFKAAPIDYFNLATDPLNQAADRAAVLLFLRRDLTPSPDLVTLSLLGRKLENGPVNNQHLVPGWNWISWISGTATRLVDPPANDDDLRGPPPTVAGGRVHDLPLELRLRPKMTVNPYQRTGEDLLGTLRGLGILAADNPTDPACNRFRANSGELDIDGERGSLIFDTPRIGGGYAEAGQDILAPRSGVTVRGLTLGATVFVAALDDQPVSTSRRLLVTHLTDLQNTGARFAEGARRTLLAWGGLPHLVARGTATVTVKLADASALKVWALSTGGRRLEEVSATATADGLTFIVDVKGRDGARLCYEIAKP